MAITPGPEKEDFPIPTADVPTNAADIRKAVRAAADFKFSLPHTRARIGAQRLGLLPLQVTHLSMGDSYALKMWREMDRYIAPLAGLGGMVNSQSLFGGPGAVTFSGASYIGADFTYSPTACHIPLTSGQLTNFLEGRGFDATRMYIFFSRVSGGGSFKVEQKIGTAGAWTDLTTAQATNAAPQTTDNGGTRDVGVLTINWGGPATDQRFIRIVGVSGTSSILGAHYSNNSQLIARSMGGPEEFEMNLSGSRLVDQATCPQQAFTAILGAIKPHFATVKCDDNASDLNSGLPAIMTKVNTAMGTLNLDWVMVAKHPTGGDQSNELTLHDIAMRDIALSTNSLWLDVRGAFPPYAKMSNSNPIPYLNPDNYHLSNYGEDLQKGVFFDAVSDVLGVTGYTGPPFFARPTRTLVPTNTATQYNIVTQFATGGYGVSDGNSTNLLSDVSWPSVPGWNAPRRGFTDHSYVRQLWAGIGWIDLTGNSGGGFPNNQSFTRQTDSAREMFVADFSWCAPAVFSTSTGHTGHAWRIRKNASITSAGTDVAVANSQTGKQSYLGGQANSIVGTFALVAGVATINTTSAATNDHINIQLVTPGGTMGARYKVSIVNGTSFTITAVDLTGATVLTDTSSGTWEIAKGRF